MKRRQLVYMFIALVSVVFLCSTMPVLAKSSSDRSMVTSSKTAKSTKSKTSSSKSSKKRGKSTKSRKSSAKKKYSSKKSVKKSAKNMVRVNINKASASELTEITGIGPKTAKKIVDYRRKHGKFRNADELLNVKGIGEKTLRKMKSQLTF